MKKILYLTLGFWIICITSCVDLNQEPQSFLTEEEYRNLSQDITTVELAATGLYKDLWSGNYGFCTRMMRIDCAADQLLSSPKPNNTLDYIVDQNPSIGSNSADWDSIWLNFWTVITSANKLIVGTTIPIEGEVNPNDEDKLITKEDVAKYKAVVAEAYFMRSFAYFNLVRIFGDMPMVKTPEDAATPQERVAVKMIYDEIIVPSLIEATSSLPAISRSTFSSTPSKWAAKTLLADVYMTMAGWPLNLGTPYYEKASSELEAIIENATGLSLTSPYGDLWQEAKKQEANEHMFAVHNSVLYKVASQYGKSFYPRDFSPYAGWADYYANPEYMEIYPSGDRKDFNYMTSWSTTAGEVEWKKSMDKLPCVAKYQDYDNRAAGQTAQSNGITPIYRYADVLLMYAEASNLATGIVNDLALQCIQEVQDRAVVTAENRTTTTNSTDFDTEVLDEAGFEFLAETGKRWFDLVRREKVSVYTADKYEVSSMKSNNHYYFPVPATQIQLTGWTNNVGY